MITIQYVYESYRRAQSKAFNRPYRLPKDFGLWFVNANKKTQENLEIITKYFNTKWQNINPEEYFTTGFNIWKNFSYHQFLNPKILNLYIDRDKLKKRSLMGCKADLIKGRKYVISTYGNITFSEYCKMKDGEIHQPVSDFLNNKIGKYTLTYLIYKRYLVLEDHERSLLSIITNNYRDIVAEIEEIGEQYI